MSELLSSDVLERQFGPLEFTVLQQDDTGRIIRNAAIETGKIVELSRVTFRPEGAQLFPDVHQKILGGASMGEAFREAGLHPDRRIHVSSRYDQRTLPDIFAQQFDSQEAPIVTHLTLEVGPEDVPYADIVEVFRPETQPWEQDGSDHGQEVADQLVAFGAELAELEGTRTDSPDTA